MRTGTPPQKMLPLTAAPHAFTNNSAKLRMSTRAAHCRHRGANAAVSVEPEGEAASAAGGEVFGNLLNRA
ncbi:MAG: hypothetical protein LBS59_07950 [Puniceicoccales bacterium]|jgi:hypothetical protein|nr:hypothetical protein [Puniceicoccales bacterium]